MTRPLRGAARLVALLLAIGAAAPDAWAQRKRDDAGDDADDEDDARANVKNKADAADDTPEDIKKQDLSGHDLGTNKDNVFARDRFFLDKTDTGKTAKSTLVQGSLTSTTFGYHETGGDVAAQLPDGSPISSASQFDRLFTDLRLQTDFRHIGAGKWDARIDVRGRVVNDPGSSTPLFTPATSTKVQSGFLGENELEIKEAWLLRSGARSDLFVGRQFVADLGGVKIDGLRVDYASSNKFTLLGFGGLYPIRGSRSVTSDYTPLLSNPAPDGSRSDAGRFTGAGGFGAAYRTDDTYGSFGGVALVPFSSESPRVFATSTGYWRYGSQLDFYHFAVLDLVGSNAVNAGFTNLSAGLNYKPDQRLRGTLAFHRVDTETLNVQAQAFLGKPDAVNVVQNEAYLQRIATNEGRTSLSAGLGQLQRFEVTAALAYRYRGEVKLTAPPQPGVAANSTTLPAAQSAELYGSITDRRSFGDLRLGIDGSRIFGVGSATYQRTTSMSVRLFASHELSKGRGEWELEAAYASNKDDNAGMNCADIVTCYGSSHSTIFSVGGNIYYRINRDWFTMGSVFLNHTAITHVDSSASTDDPAVIGITGYFRIAYRF